MDGKLKCRIRIPCRLRHNTAVVCLIRCAEVCAGDACKTGGVRIVRCPPDFGHDAFDHIAQCSDIARKQTALAHCDTSDFYVSSDHLCVEVVEIRRNVCSRKDIDVFIFVFLHDVGEIICSGRILTRVNQNIAVFLKVLCEDLIPGRSVRIVGECDTDLGTCVRSIASCLPQSFVLFVNIFDRPECMCCPLMIVGSKCTGVDRSLDTDARDSVLLGFGFYRDNGLGSLNSDDQIDFVFHAELICHFRAGSLIGCGVVNDHFDRGFFPVYFNSAERIIDIGFDLLDYPVASLAVAGKRSCCRVDITDLNCFACCGAFSGTAAFSLCGALALCTFSFCAGVRSTGSCNTGRFGTAALRAAVTAFSSTTAAASCKHCRN